MSSTILVSPSGSYLPGAGPFYAPGELPSIRAADMATAYVSAARYGWADDYATGVYDTLASHAARMVALYGDQLYDAMEDDGTVSACDELLRAAVIGDGVQLNPAVTSRVDGEQVEEGIEPEEGADLDDADAELALEVRDYCKRATGALPGDEPLEGMLWDLLAAYSRGNALAEVVWSDPLEGGPDAGFRHLVSVRVKPRSSWKFVIDESGRIAGFAIRGVRQRRDRDPRRYLPRSKCVLLRNNPRPSRPEGRGDFQAIYNPWNEKVLLRPEHWKYTATFASPFVWGTCAENAQPVLDSDGNTIDPVTAMLNAVMALPRKKAGAGGYGSDVKVLAPPGEGAAFSIFDAKCRVEIIERLLHQARNAARLSAGPDDRDSPQDDLTYIVRYRKTRVEQVLRDDLYRPLVEDRYGPEVAQRLTPWPRLGRVDIFYFSRFANAFARLVQVGAVPPELLPEMFDVLGLMGFCEPRDVARLVRQAQAGLDATQAQTDEVRARAELARKQATAPAPQPAPSGV